MGWRDGAVVDTTQNAGWRSGIPVEEGDDLQQAASPPNAEPIWDKETGEIVPENIVPYYKQGIENLKDSPFETIFPAASSVKGEGFGPAVKRNVLGAIDVLGIPDRVIDYASGGAFERGKQTISEGIERLPGDKGPARLGKDILQSGKDIATSPSSYIGLGTVKNALTKETPEIITKKLAKQTKELDKVIQKGLDKGIAPKVKNKSSFSKMSNFNKKGATAVKTIAEYKDMFDLVDDVGEKIAQPRNAAEFAQAIEKTKGYIYKQYHEMAKAAGDAGATFKSKPIITKLKKLADPDGFYKGNKSAQNHVAKIIDDIKQLEGAAPEIVQERIREFNESLAGFYAGRAEKVGSRIDGSTANLLRKQLDDQIEKAAGDGYQELKNKYGSLKTIEKEVNHRAIINARKNTKGLTDLTDIFTGGDLVAGALTHNPALIAKGITGKVIKGAIKKANNPDKYIEKMFKEVYENSSPYSWTSSTPERAVASSISEEVQSVPTYARKGINPEGQFAKKQARKSAVTNAIKKQRPKYTSSQEAIEAMRRHQAGKSPLFQGIPNE